MNHPSEEPAFLPVLVLSAAEDEHRDHVIPRQFHRDRYAVAVGLVAEFILRGAATISGERVRILNGTEIEWLAAPCGRAIRAILSRELTVGDMLAEIEGPAYTVAWSVLKRDRVARRSLLRRWVLTDPDLMIEWRHVLASAHLGLSTDTARAAALWAILDGAGVHRDQLQASGLQPRDACPDVILPLLRPIRRPPAIRRQHR
ncbi:hypothetical protein [Amycolatopsis keratiniphila]|uniref:hypothetical protein n=1 Tax=Amycolatopsis keratiniphila TaxID=129921 RepID=UPI0008799F99|nr:hypothetical protein [Amycolatopsis keratiniphila]SDU67260.1 hypothetical protein SAMN04489733_8093 [Amycolatopsis keratiniphila]